MAGLVGIFRSTKDAVANTVHNMNSDGRDKQAANAMREACEALSMLSAIGLVGSVVIGLLGIGTCLSGRPQGAGTLAVSAIPVYFTYNINKLSETGKHLADNIGQYRTYVGTGGLDIARLREDLKQNTICFEWFIDMVILKNLKK